MLSIQAKQLETNSWDRIHVLEVDDETYTSVIPALAPSEGWQMSIAKAHQLLSWSMQHGYVRKTLPSLPNKVKGEKQLPNVLCP